MSPSSLPRAGDLAANGEAQAGRVWEALASGRTGQRVPRSR